MNNYAIAWLVILLINLLFSSHLHGKPKEGYHSFWNDLIGSLIGLALLLGAIGFYN